MNTEHQPIKSTPATREVSQPLQAMKHTDNRPAFKNQNQFIQSIQRKEAHLTGLYGGVVNAPPQGNGPAVGVNGNVNIYEEALNPSIDKVTALQTIAQQAAAIGNVVAQNGITQSYLVQPDPAGNNSVDPFIYRAKTIYDVPVAGPAAPPLIPGGQPIPLPPIQKSLELDYQMANQFTGYVIKVHEDTVAAPVPPAPPAPAPAPAPVAAPITGSMVVFDKKNPPGNGQYSNIHEKTAANNILNLTDQTTPVNPPNLPQQQIGWDSMTKLAGEGARFQCISNNMNTITDDTWIYTPGPNINGTPNPGVQFNTLWVRWKDWFNKEYNISDNAVANALINRKDPKIQDTTKKAPLIKVV